LSFDAVEQSELRQRLKRVSSQILFLLMTWIDWCSRLNGCWKSLIVQAVKNCLILLQTQNSDWLNTMSQIVSTWTI